MRRTQPEPAPGLGCLSLRHSCLLLAAAPFPAPAPPAHLPCRVLAFSLRVGMRDWAHYLWKFLFPLLTLQNSWVSSMAVRWVGGGGRGGGSTPPSSGRPLTCSGSTVAGKEGPTPSSGPLKHPPSSTLPPAHHRKWSLGRASPEHRSAPEASPTALAHGQAV